MKTNMDVSSYQETNFRLWLQSELTKRCKRNPKYSLRAFAAFLSMDASSVSQILSGKRHASVKVIEKICKSLSAHPFQKNLFLKKIKSSKFQRSPLANFEYDLLVQDSFTVISEWYHYAILELINIDGFQNKPAWISRSLGITISEVHIALERMKRLELIREENEKLYRTQKFITNFTPGMTSAAHKNLQRQIIQMALDAVESCPQETKDITSMTMAIDVLKLPEARKMITQFRRQLSALLEDGAQTRVYQLGIQLYPVSNELTKKGESHEH